jgi:signal transduction histidine kinase
MNLHAVPVAALAGICGYAAMLFIGLHASLANVAEARARREYLSFALCCLAVASYDVACALLYNAQSLEQGLRAQRAQMLTAGMIGITYLVFTWDFMARRMPRFLAAICWALVPLSLLATFWDNPHSFTASTPAIKHVAVLGHEIIYYESDPGIFPQLLMLDVFVLYAITTTYQFRYFFVRLHERRPGHLGFVIAFIVSGVCATNDIMITVGVYQSLYMFEYGIVAILMAMGYVLLMRFGDLHKAVNDLNRELSRTNADLVLALEQAQESVRLKTEFLAAVSHELRTPLNAIINLPEALLDELAPTRIARCVGCRAEFQLDQDEHVTTQTCCDACQARGVLREEQRLSFVGDASQAQACLRTVTGAGKHLLSLVNDLLAGSKLELGRVAIELEPVDPGALLQDVARAAQSIADDKQVELRILEAEHASSESFLADRVKLTQVLFNLLSNAIKFSASGAAVELRLSMSAGKHLFSVRDHGIGIAPEHHQVIFEKFRQVEGGSTRAYGGTGLGLWISKGLVELHGGRIWVESKKGQGAAFFVELPLQQAANDVRLEAAVTQTRVA